MPARLILIGSCLLISACATPWQRDDGQAGADIFAERESVGGQNAKFDPQRMEPTPPLLPIDDPASDIQQVTYFEAGETDPLGQPLTIDELLQYAFEHHPILRVRQHKIEAARGRRLGAGLMQNPELVLNVDRLLGDDRYRLGGRVMFDVLTAGKPELQEEQAAAAVARAKKTLNREAKQVLSRTAQAAVDVMYYQQLAQLYGRLGKLANKAAAWQKSRVESGDISALDGFVLQADATEIDQERLSALRQLKVAQITLAQAIGAGDLRNVEVEGQLIEAWLPDIPLETVLDELNLMGPELSEQQAAIRLSEARERLEKANAVPNIGIGPRWSETIGDAAGRYGLRVDGEIPIFNRNQGGIAASEAEFAREVAMLEVVRLETLGDAARVYAELAPLRGQLEDYATQIEPMLDETEKSVNEAIDERLIDPDDLNAHIRRLVRMRLYHLRNRYQYAQLHMQLVAASPSAIKERRRAADQD